MHVFSYVFMFLFMAAPSGHFVSPHTTSRCGVWQKEILNSTSEFGSKHLWLQSCGHLRSLGSSRLIFSKLLAVAQSFVFFGHWRPAKLRIMALRISTGGSVAQMMREFMCRDASLFHTSMDGVAALNTAFFEDNKIKYVWFILWFSTQALCIFWKDCLNRGHCDGCVGFKTFKRRLLWAHWTDGNDQLCADSCSSLPEGMASCGWCLSDRITEKVLRIFRSLLRFSVKVGIRYTNVIVGLLLPTALLTGKKALYSFCIKLQYNWQLDRF